MIKDYKFDGKWQFNLKLKALNEFHLDRKEVEIKILILDFLDDSLDPYPEQIRCINYIIQNQSKIKNSILKEIWEKWNEIREDNEIDEWDDFPTIEKKNDIKTIIRVDEIYIHPFHKNGISYFGIMGDCLWDEEHGLGMIFHNEKLISFGNADEANQGGCEYYDSPENQEPEIQKIPKLYPSHPKYKAHQRRNLDFINNLVEKGGDIHETRFGTSILSEAIEQHLRIIASNLTEEQMIENQQKSITFYKQYGTSKFSNVSKEVTLHPRLKITNSRKYIETLFEYDLNYDDNKIDYVKYGHRNDQKALDAIEKEVIWIKQL